MIPRPRRFHRVTLELSLKSFDDLTGPGIDATCRRIWRNWRRLVDRADDLALLLWVGTGDEILAWSGREDDPVPCASNIGFNNLRYPGAYDPTIDHYTRNAARPFRDQPVDLRYRDLKRIIATLKQTADAELGKPPMVGATIDPGPEFADSPWRYQTHPELLQEKLPRLPYPMHFITHQASLHADTDAYAGFPEGIAEGTRVGTLLGKQFEAARQRLGFDTIWFSNGLAYSHHPWTSRGNLFDGERFWPELAAEQRELANRFWHDFREQTDAPIDVRGTNFSVGVDLATDGCSHVDITSIGGLERPPCNPPWGSRALGLEMVAYLSRLAKTPGDRLPFRFYLNDPWFVTLPWYDYYAQQPFDIYAPLSAARLNDTGGVDTPTDLNLLTIDSSYGELIEDQAGEVTPHLLTAMDRAPDAPGPVVWVYPFDEYHRVLHDTPDRLNHLFAHDWFMCRAVESGLPLNTVCSSGRFVSLQQAGRLGESVYVAPVPVGDWAYGDALLHHVQAGGKVILYGSTEHAPQPILDGLRITHDTPIEGELRYGSALPTDVFESQTITVSGESPAAEEIGLAMEAAEGAVPVSADRPLIHRGVVSGGGVREVCGDASLTRASVADGDRRRAYVISRADPAWRGGRLVWTRSTTGLDPTPRNLEAAWDAPEQAVQAAESVRYLLREFGYEIVQHRHDEGVRPAYVFMKRHRGGWYVTGHKPDTSVRFFLRTPDGAPVYEEAETPIVDGRAGECFGKSFHQLVRAFVRMPDGIVRCKRLTVPVGLRYQFSMTHLVDADVTIYPDPTARPLEEVSVQAHLWTDPVVCERDHVRHTLTVRNYTGSLYIKW